MSDEKINIAIFQRDLNVGGIQKSLINLLNNIDINKYNIDLYLFNNINFFENKISDKINIYYLKSNLFIIKFIYFNLFKLIKNNYKIKKNYDIAIDFDSYQHTTALGAISVNAKKRIIWIHNDIEQKIKAENKYKILHHFFKGKYKYFDTFVGVSTGAIDGFKTVHNLKDKQYIVIPNYIDTQEILEKSKEPIDLDIDFGKYNLVSVGRLCHQKGFDILINHMIDVINANKDIHLYIIGDGPDRNKLQKQITDNKLTSYITLLGSQKNPFSFLRHMDGFILTSRYEGQGMVLLEAKCLGLKLIFPKYLEKYNTGLVGSDDISQAILSAQKENKQEDMLIEYNESIKKEIDHLFDVFNS